MSIERYDVSNDKTVYESWPDLVLTEGGKLICVFCECVAHNDRSYSRPAYVESVDRGKTWSGKKYLTEGIHSDGSCFWDCPRISRMKDGGLAVLCNRNSTEKAEIYFWQGDGEGINWSEPIKTVAEGIVPDKLFETSTGRMIITCHTDKADGFSKLQQRLWYSDDKGKSWSDAVTVARDERYNLCEASLLEVEQGVLVCFMRENSNEGYECLTACSRDDGLTWSEVYTTPLACCHRPVSGFLSTGEIMITYRYKQGTNKGWLGHWTQNTFLAIMDKETVLTGDRNKQRVRIMPVNYDPNPLADLGYTGWVEFPDGMIYIVDYIMGKEAKAHIIGCSMHRSDIGGMLYND